MLDWKLPLFPQDSVAVTVTVTVWIGVCLVVFFNLRLGWPLSGLVVPGYLAPLLLAQPASAAIICAEAAVTYLIVYALSESCPRLSCWSSVFGRDRFFALVLFSVLVRAAADGWLIPWLGQWLNATYGWEIDYRNDLHSYGLIVVALMANCFWKPGLVRGSVTLAVTIGLTYLVVRFGLIAWTNFNLGGVRYLYEDISSSLLASPKAYVVILTTAFLASWINLRYSWDFNGILIPALLALLWHDPLKVGLSLAETLWILLLAKLLLKLPLWRHMTIEGGRKILLFFTIATVHRLLLAHLLPRFTAMQVTDAFGFGYLLTTLLAIKAHEKQMTVRLLRSVVQVSMLGAVVGSFLGFALTWLPTDLRTAALPGESDDTPVRLQEDNRSLEEQLREQSVRLYCARIPDNYRPPWPHEIDRFRTAIRHVLQFTETRQPDALLTAQSDLARIDYRLRIAGTRYAVLSEIAPYRGWGWYVLDLASNSSLLVEVPLPLDEPGTMDAGLALFQAMNGRGLAIGGTSRETSEDGSADVLNQRPTILAAFHRLIGQHETLQIRQDSCELLPTTALARRSFDPLKRQPESTLWIESGLPNSLPLPTLKQLVPSFHVQWQRRPSPNVLREQSRRGFVELVLSAQDCVRFRSGDAQVISGGGEPLPTRQGYLYQWLMADKDQIAVRNSQAYVPASLEEMLYLDQEVLSPLIQLAARRTTLAAYRHHDWEQLKTIRRACRALQYDLIPFQDQTSGDDLLLLTEMFPKKRHWGTFVFRCGLTHPYAVEIPRPLQERYAYEFGVALFERPAASVLIAAGANPDANPDGSADVTRLANKVSAYNLVRQVLLREQPTRTLIITQARAIRAPVGADVVLAIDEGVPRLSALPPLVQQMVDRLQQDGLKVMLADGSFDTAGYELGILLQASATNHSQNKRMISLWLSPSVRRKFRESEQQALQHAQFDAVGIPTTEAELAVYLRGLAAGPAGEPCDEAFQEAVSAYLENSDILRLWNLRQRWPSSQLLRLIDVASGQTFLLASWDDSWMPVVFNLSGSVDRQRQVVIERLDVEAVREFVRSRAGSLEIRSTP